MLNLITSPLVILAVVYGGLTVLAIYSIHVAELCGDKIDGLVSTDRSVRSLMAQKGRAERTAATCFGVGLLLAMTIVGTLEYASL